MRFLLFILCSVVMLGSAEARQCYVPSEMEAEQGIRIHSELMVIALNCQSMVKPGFQNIYVQYRTYTKQNENLFEGYERTLMNYFRASGSLNPERDLNDLRTRFANKISNDAAAMRPDIFCAQYAPRIPQVAELSRTDFREWARTPYPSHPVSRPLCH